MPKPRTGPGQPQNDIYEFSLDAEDMRISSTDKSSPLRNFIETEHQQAGLYSLPGLDSLDASDIQKKRRRKCGVCGPCLLRKNCGNCGNCLNRKTGKQICKLRKCDALKKRRDETEVDYPEDASALSLDTTRPTAETVCRVTSVDGPRSGGQMEIGSHDRLQEGASNLNLANGVSRYANGDEAPMEEEQHRQGWVPGQPKVSDSQQHHNWTSRPNTTRESIQHVDIEDARNLVAFSTTVSRPPSTSSSAHVQQNTSRLYEKFTQEMGEGEQVGQPDGLAKGSCQGPDDLDTLQTALSQAKHGHKPPNCNCDGPDCPDYLEWLEKKIKLATDDDKAPCSKSITHTQQTNGNGGPSTFPQQQQGHNPQQAPGSKPPIPCSPQVLSIAKERNVSLQTAIAIEALTQLSGTGSQASGSLGHYNNNLHQTNLQNHPTNGIGHSFSRSQSVPPGLHTVQPAQDQRPQSQGPPPHASPLQSSTSPFPGQGFNPHPQHPQHWQQGAGQGEQRNMWMGAKSEAHFAPHGNQDPMSELKQLLGDHTGKFDNAPFRLPVQQNMHPQANIALDKIKKEQDSSEHYPMDPYGMANGHQHYPGMPMSPNQAAIRHSTQAALQQHLHYKRNLFSNHSPAFAGPRAPNACQNLKKWWPQVGPQAMTQMAIKQEPKEPKRRKSMQGPPIINAMGGILTPPPPKPKQIVIKKTKQKASVPLFMPQNQISAQKSPVFRPVQSGFHTSTLPTLPLPSGLFPPLAPGLTQVPHSLATQTSTSSENSTDLTTKSAAQSNTSTSSTLTTHSSSLSNLINIDPKYEDLIRQFEAEFGGPEEQLLANSQAIQSKNSNESQGPPSTNPSNSSTQDQNMDTKEARDQSKESRETPMEEQRKGTGCNQSLHQEVERQQQPVAGEDKFCMPSSPFPKRMKFETSGDISVLSTTCYSEDDTPTKDFPASPSLKGFLESPLRYLDTPTKNLLDTPSKDLQAEFPICNCVEQILEKDEGPYYNHLGAGPTVASIRTLMETRYGQAGEAVRIEKAVYTGREGKSSRGCPIAKWVIRRGSEKEKLLCLVRQRPGHHCDNAVIIILIMAWEGVPSAMADKLYREVSDTLTQYGNPTSRRCGLNDDRTCACQGKDPDKCGASFSFGCSWSMYFNGCKYARSKIPRKFRLQGEHPEHEDILRDNFQNLATEVAPLYKRLAPQAYSNQCLTESTAPDCRLGLKEGRPFSGITACMDFCAHAHKDQHNLYNGCTVVCTLTKEDNRKVGVIPEDEQLHVLPLYKISPTDEFGSEEGQRAKMKTGALQILQAFRREVRKLPEPAKSCRQRRLDAKKAASEKKKNKLMAQTGETPEKVVIKTELRVTSSPQLQGNKAVIKQEVKPIIKKEPFNGSLDGFPVQSAEALNIYPQAAYYARGGLPPTGRPSSPSPVNGYHPNLHYGYYNCPPNALFRPKIRTYERKAAHVDTKPDVQSLQACLSQPEQNVSNNSAYTTNLEYQSRPSSVSSEHTATPVIKQEPMDLPVHEAAMQSPAGGNTPSTTPQPGSWPGHKFNGNIVPPNLNSNPSAGASMLSQEHKQFHQHPQQRASPFPQQWYPGSNTPMGSPSPLHAPPSPVPSPHLMNPHNMHSASPRPTTPRPSTPHPGTPQPAIANSGQVPSQPGTPRPWSRLSPSPQANPWAMAPGGYSPVIKHNNSRGAFPDKMWSESGERCSTPVDPQEKAWKSYGGSAASTTPSPAPEGRLFPDALQQTEQACWDRNQESDVESCKGREDDDDEVWSDSEHNFLDPSIGGVAVAPAHGSILIECARRELHATTPLKRPDRTHPTRISLVFYQHKNLNQPNHGLHVWEAKMKLLAERTLQRQQEAALLGLSQEDIKALGKKRKWGASAAGASPGPGQTKDKREGPVTRLAPTFHTTSMVQVSPYAFTQLTGPYSRFV